MILDDCDTVCLITTAPLLAAVDTVGVTTRSAASTIKLDTTGDGSGLAAALVDGPARISHRRASAISAVAPEDLACILYTSGSTGRPKGVMLSHENALSLLDWCSRTFEPTAADHFSSHAPLHFDLSILDIFLPLGHGARLVLLDADEGRNPQLLAERIQSLRVTSYYNLYGPTETSVCARWLGLPASGDGSGP